MLRVEKVSKDWKEFRLKEISFKVNEGEYFIILGPSGAGKTLLLEIIAGIFIPDSGRIYINGEDITYLHPENRNFAYIPQDYALFPHMKVYDNIAYGLKLRKISKREIDRNVKEIADILGISHLLHRKPKTLSGGEMQRVAIARALILEPKLLLLDEPFANLDVQTRAKLIQEMKRWQKELEFTALHVTHSFEEALSLGDKVGIILDGEFVQYGRVKDVFANPRDERVAKFLGFENIFEARVSENELILNGISIKINRLHKKSRIKVAIKPDSILVSAKPINMGNVFKGRIVAFEDLGFLVKLTIEVNGTEFKAFVTRLTFFDSIYGNKEVYIGFESSSIHYFD